jgi:predicted DNA-binding transcriptional regulator AlpA
MVGNTRPEGWFSEDLVSVQDLARHLGVSVSWVYRNRDSLGIPYSQVGKFLRFRPSQIQEWERNS